MAGNSLLWEFVPFSYCPRKKGKSKNIFMSFPGSSFLCLFSNNPPSPHLGGRGTSCIQWRALRVFSSLQVCPTVGLAAFPSRSLFDRNFQYPFYSGFIFLVVWVPCTTGILEFWPHKSLVRGFFHCLWAVPQVLLNKSQDLICFRCDSFDMW